MMLRSLVKKFKSHSLNEDGAAGSDHSPGESPPSATTTFESEIVQQQQSNPTSNNVGYHPSTTQTSILVNSLPAETVPTTMNNPMPRHHHLRSSCGCCNPSTVSSIATRLRSSVMAATAGQQQQQHHHHQGPSHHRHCNSYCGGHRRNSGGGGGASRKAGGDVQDDDCYKDSGTESDDEELERIETNSTHSVPVSQTSDYYASQQSLSINSCRSSHCSSPLLGLSDQECNSWESIGSESGISVRTARQHCQHQKHHQCRSSTAMRPPSEMLMQEELPQHHYHTRQQFQRLTQQISMKNGLISSSNVAAAATSTSTPTSNLECSEKSDHRNNTGAHGTTLAEGSQQPTAFVPVRRMTTVEQSPEGAGSSSLDELEEVNFGIQQQKTSRRARTGMVTAPVPGLASSEKRKWSQMQQRRQECEKKEDGEKKRQEGRPVLHAARKTPIRLLFSLDGGDGGGGGSESEKLNLRTTSSRCQVQQQQQQLPQHGNVSPPAGNSAKKLRSTKTKKCKGCEDEEGTEGKSSSHRCPPNDEEDDEEEAGRTAKRPSLDFNKMRGKLVGIGATSGRNKKTKRSNSLISCSGMKAKLKTIGGRREGYQLRSTHRQCCLFRPLEPPTSSTITTTTGMADGDMTDQQHHTTSPGWFPHPQHETGFQTWQQQGLSGTFYFGSQNTSGE